MALLTCRDLSVGYEGQPVLAGLDFAVEAGDYLCIVGENGAGKSTLLRTLLRLIPPLGGEILLGDGLAPNEIGYLPQQTQVQRDFPASVTEIVLSGCQGRRGLRPFYTREERDLAARMMERLEIGNLAKRCYPELSGGQQQRVLLARALCATRKLLLLDEPVAGLDPRVTAELYQLIEELNRGKRRDPVTAQSTTEPLRAPAAPGPGPDGDRITIIMISHDIAAAVRYASHILHIGRRIFFGTKEAYLESSVGRAFLAQEAAT